MSALDSAEFFASMDPGGMRILIQSVPAQVEGAAEVARTLSLAVPGHIDHVVISGMGGSAIGGDVIRSACAEYLKVPLLVFRDYRLPGFIGSSTVVFASSYSGNTEETLAAYDQARSVGANIFCLTSGGKLAARACADGYPVIQIPAGLPPRAALGYCTSTLLGAMTALKLIPDMTEALHGAVELLKSLVIRYGPEAVEQKNPAKAIARTLHGRVIAIYASTVFDPVALRWRGQIEENAKTLAFHHVLPEMNHNELVGWEYPGEVLRKIAVVFLRDRGDHPQVQRRFELTKGILEQRAEVVHEIWSEGESLLARLHSLICLGDFVSFYLACLNAVDPTPVAVIENFQEKLGK